MKTLKIGAVAFLFLGLTACSGEVKYKTDSSSGFYTIDVPERMESTNELHAEALTQYKYVVQEGTEVKENYIIVLMETKSSIDALGLDLDLDALTYAEIAVQNLEGGLESSNILTPEPKIESINGMDCAKIEMEGSLGALNAYYKIAVFEGENAFYQVVTWTLKDQKEEFSPIMDKMINSFKETI